MCSHDWSSTSVTPLATDSKTRSQLETFFASLLALEPAKFEKWGTTGSLSLVEQYLLR